MRDFLNVTKALGDETRVRALLTVKDDDPEDLESLDEIWEEAEVTFGPDPDAGCPVSRDLLAQMDPVINKPQPGVSPRPAE